MNEVYAAATEELLALLARRDHDGAVDLLLHLAHAGQPVDALLTEIIAPAQRRVGQLWHRGEWSIADEHAATAVADAAVAAVSAERRGPPSPGAPAVVVACPEGEWHSLPARIFSELVRSRGAAPRFLGASVPADHLARFVREVQPDVVALSCSTALSFPGLVAATVAVHDVGVPVLAGGLALGDDAVRAGALGADAWGEGADAVDRALAAGPTAGTPPPSADVAARSLRLGLERPALVARATVELERHLPVVTSFDDRRRRRTAEDFDYLCRYAEMTLLCGDQRLMDGFVRWLDELLTARGLPAGTLSVSLHALLSVCDDPEVKTVLGAAAASLSVGAD